MCVQVDGRGEMDARTDGGLPSADPNEIYYVGVIDMLVPYSTRKKLEVRTRLITTSRFIGTDERWGWVAGADEGSVGECAAWRGCAVRHGPEDLRQPPAELCGGEDEQRWERGARQQGVPTTVVQTHAIGGFIGCARCWPADFRLEVHFPPWLLSTSSAPP